MSKTPFVKLEVPEEIVNATYEAIQLAFRTGNIRKGTNETTKAIERSQAKLVIMASDVDPPEVVAHLPLICEERNIPYVIVPSKTKLGSVAGINVPSAAVCISEPGEAADLVKEIVKRISKLKGES
jgi:large subunit ribosomal protein L7Ae